MKYTTSSAKNMNHLTSPGRAEKTVLFASLISKNQLIYGKNKKNYFLSLIPWRMMILAIFFGMSGLGWGQTHNMYWTFNQSSTNCALNVMTQTPLTTNITGSFTYTDICTTTTGTATSGSPLVTVSTAGNALRNSIGANNTEYWYFTLTGTELACLSGFQVYFQMKRNVTGETYPPEVTYSIDGGAYTGAQTITVGNANTWYAYNLTFSSISGITNSLTFRIEWGQADAGTNADLDNFQIRGTYANTITAAFSANATLISSGSGVNFTDETSPSPTSWSWSFEGGTPSTSTAQNPIVTYNTAGIYNVTLNATSPCGSDAETKTDYIIVYNASYNYTTAQTNTSVTIPSCVTGVTVLAWGAGGGGSNRSDAAGGGGGGAFTKGALSGLTPGQSLSLTVGAVGTAGTPTTAPGNYSRVTYSTNTLQANGGLSVNNSRTGGAGGTAQTVGGIIEAAYAGGSGGNGRPSSTQGEGGGGGGGSAFIDAIGGNGVSATSSTGGAGGDGYGDGGRGSDSDGSPDAVAGSSPGGGGGGAGEWGGTSKAGAAGQVILIWQYSTVTPSVGIAITSGSNPTCSGNSVTFTATPTNGGSAPTY